jgi:hypothetical protein
MGVSKVEARIAFHFATPEGGSLNSEMPELNEPTNWFKRSGCVNISLSGY